MYHHNQASRKNLGIPHTHHRWARQLLIGSPLRHETPQPIKRRNIRTPQDRLNGPRERSGRSLLGTASAHHRELGEEFISKHQRAQANDRGRNTTVKELLTNRLSQSRDPLVNILHS